MQWLLAQGPADLPPWLLLVAAALALVLLWRTLAPSSWRGWPWHRSDPLSRPADPSLAQQRSVERDMQTLMHELSELSRKITQQLDARSTRLTELIGQADRRIEILRELANRAPREGASPPPASPASSGPELNIEIDPRNERIYALEDEGLNVTQISNRLNIPEGEIELILALRPRRREVV